jgi:hypothetical protein
MSHKKRSYRRTVRATPCFVFTPETITLLEKAIAIFEEPLAGANHQDTTLAFAEETIQQVKTKLANMKQSVGEMCLTSFDFNEKIVIRQSVLLYSLDLLELPGPKPAKELRQCRRIAMHFTN